MNTSATKCEKRGCSCSSYGDLALNRNAIDQRVRDFPAIRANLRQVATKLVERWSSHFRLYVCDACGQRWQSSVAASPVGEWIAFKVPTMPIKEWKALPFVCPDRIVVYLSCRTQYFKKNLTRRTLRATVLVAMRSQ